LEQQQHFSVPKPAAKIKAWNILLNNVAVG
jgi:hypothetical protein